MYPVRYGYNRRDPNASQKCEKLSGTLIELIGWTETRASADYTEFVST
jgi:hypothetical protein